VNRIQEITTAPTTNRSEERIVLLTLAAVQFTSIVDFMVIMPLGPQLMRSLQIGPAQFGLVVSSYTLAAGIAGLIASSLADRVGRKAAFLGLDAGFLIGTLLCGLAPSYITLVWARLATGAFGGILGGMAMAIIGDVFPEERRGRATGALMSAFALASVVGVPFGLYLGTRFGWNAPFLLLAALGCPVLAVAAVTLPPLRGHIAQDSSNQHPLRLLIDTFTQPNHVNAFALIITLMFAGFSVFPYVSPYLVTNVGMAEDKLPLTFVAGGILTLFSAPMIGRLADLYGKLRVFRFVAPASAVMTVAVTNLVPVHTSVAVAAVAGLMVSNSGRMVAAMAMITSSVPPARRGGFLSASSSVQHLAAGFGAYVGGLIIVESADGSLQNFPTVGLLSAIATIVSVWLVGRIQPAANNTEISTNQVLAATAEALCDATEPLI
jgi:MFS transporter, DHA1 family, inner membrane transport protein